MPNLHLLFSSYHCYLDDSSGAALSTRDLLELLTSRGWSCRVFCGPHLDFEDGRGVAQLLRDRAIPFEERAARIGPVPFSLLHFQQGGISVAGCDTPAARSSPEPTPYEGDSFLALLDRLLEHGTGNVAAVLLPNGFRLTGVTKGTATVTVSGKLTTHQIGRPPVTTLFTETYDFIVD